MFADTDVTVFVERDDAGLVKGVYRRPQPGYAEEELLADHADVLDFQQRMTQPRGAQ